MWSSCMIDAYPTGCFPKSIQCGATHEVATRAVIDNKDNGKNQVSSPLHSLCVETFCGLQTRLNAPLATGQDVALVCMYKYII